MDSLDTDGEGGVEVGKHAEDQKGSEVRHLPQELDECTDEGTRVVKKPGLWSKDMSWRLGCTACSAP